MSVSPEAAKSVPKSRVARLQSDLHTESRVFFRGAILLSLFSLVQGVPAKTLIDGSAQPCADVKETTSGIPGVRAYVFNAAKVPAIRKSLNALDSLEWESGDPEAMRGAAVEYNRLISLVRRAPKLGYAMSNGNGDFEIMVPQMDSVLVFGEARMPGAPFYYSAKVVGANGVEEVRVVLLMCSQQLL